MKAMTGLRDRKGGEVTIVRYRPVLKAEVMALYKEGYPDSFDDYDIPAIERDLGGKTTLLAMRKKRVVGALQFFKWPAIQAGYILSYLYVREKGLGVGEVLVAALEEFLKREARIIFTTHAGILPDYASSYSFFTRNGYAEWGVLPGYFRDDLWGVFFVKRNPYYPLGKGIPRNSGWCKEMVDERTGRRISREEYREIKNGLKPVPKEKWGLKRRR